MDMKTIYRLLSVMTVTAFAVFGTSCTKRASDIPSMKDGVVVFSLDIDGEEWTSNTKTILTDPTIETKITSVTLGYYRSGTLDKAAFVTSGFNDISYDLDVDQTVTVYALVNMGDMRTSLPSAESGLSSLSYMIPSYTSVNTNGIPMAGSLTYTDGVSVSSAISVKRLFAKVTANLTTAWTGNITSVKIYNLNGRMLPFNAGGGYATSASDIIPSVQEYCAGSGTQTGTFVFYVPENAIGVFPGISTSAGKSPDENSTVSANQSKLTYMETVVTGAGDYSGTLTYRSYMGANATDDFNIIRNRQYVWNVSFNADGLSLQNWKHVNGITWEQYRYELSKASISVGVGGSDTFQVYQYTDIYTAGVCTTTGTVPTVLPTSAYSFVSANSSIASVSTSGTSTLEVNGIAAGTTAINIVVDGNNLSMPVTVSNVYDMVITPTEATLAAGEERTFVVTLKVNNGPYNTISNASCTWESSNNSVAYFTSATSGTLHGYADGVITVTVRHTPEPGAAELVRTATITVYTGAGITEGWTNEDDIIL